MEKYHPRRPVSVLYFDREQKKYFLRRSLVEESDKKIELLCGNPKAEMLLCTTQYLPQVEITYTDKQHPEKTTEVFAVAEWVEETKLKSKGKKLAFDKIYRLNELEPLPYEEEEEEETADELVSDSETEAEETAEDSALMEQMIRKAPFSEDAPGEGVQMNLFDD